MNSEISEQIKLTKELLKRVRHAAMATVNQDGTPHNTPYFFMHDTKFTKLFWGSSFESLHSKNIVRTGKVFVVVFDSFEHGKGGLYINADNAHELKGNELDQALSLHNSIRALSHKEPLPHSYYTGGKQRMYSADITKLEVYSAVRDENGQIKQEARVPIKAKDLVG